MCKDKGLQLVILPTENESKLSLDFYGRLFLGVYPKGTPLNQYLYLLSDEDIKVGDYCIDGETLFGPYEKGDIAVVGFKHIIASADPSLNLPQFPSSFLEEYIKRYNSKKSLEVEVEYEEWHKAKLPINFLDYIEPGSGMPIIAGTEETYYRLKKNRDNTISILFKEEKKYSRGEVEELCGEAFDAGEAYRTGSCDLFKQIHPDKHEWIKKNLK